MAEALSSRTALSRMLRRIVPFLVSAGLLAWLFSRVSLRQVAQAAGHLNWPIMSIMTALMVLGLYFWDAWCLRTVYALESKEPPLSYRRLLRVRGISYLAGAFNYELGQGFIALNMARLQSTTILHSLSRGVLLAYHDLLVLLSLGLAASLLSSDPRTAPIAKVCSIGLVLLLSAALTIILLPFRLRQRLKALRWTNWLQSWNLARTPRLLLLRLIYFGILIVYGMIALQVCGIQVPVLLALGALPLVLVADGLPSLAGLGTRETALLLLLPDAQPETLLAMSLFWSSGMIVGRLSIGLFHLWTMR
jgi:hypothetical protein